MTKLAEPVPSPTETPKTVQRILRRPVLMPRGLKTSVMRETRITLPRLRCIDEPEKE